MGDTFALWRASRDLQEDVLRFQDLRKQTVVLTSWRGIPVCQLSRAVSQFDSGGIAGLFSSHLQEENRQRERHFHEALGDMPFTSGMFGRTYVPRMITEQSVVLWRTLAQWLGSPEGWALVEEILSRAEKFPQPGNEIPADSGCRKFLETSQTCELGSGDSQGNETRISEIGPWGYGYRQREIDVRMNLANYPADIRPTEGGTVGAAAWCWMAENVVIRAMQLNRKPTLIGLLADRSFPSKADQVDAANFFPAIFGTAGRCYWERVSGAIAEDGSMTDQLRAHTTDRIGKLLKLMGRS